MDLHNIVEINSTTLLFLDGRPHPDPKAWFFDKLINQLIDFPFN